MIILLVFQYLLLQFSSMDIFPTQQNHTMQLEQIQRIKKALEPLKKVQILSKKQKQQLATKQLLQIFAIILNLQLNYILQINSQDVIPEFANFLNFVSYHQCLEGEILQIRKDDKKNQDIIILLQGSVHQKSGSSTFCKIQKSRQERCSRRKTQLYRWQVTDRQQPKLIKSIQQKYSLKADNLCKYLQIKQVGYTHLLQCICKIQKQFLLNFFNQWLNLDIEYVKYFRLHKNAEKQYRKRKEKFLIEQNYVYFVQKGELLLTQPYNKNQSTHVILTKGSIINLQSLSSNFIPTHSIIAQTKSDVIFIKLQKQFIKTLMQDNQWFKQFIQVSITNIAHQRKIIAQKSIQPNNSKFLQQNQLYNESFHIRSRKIPADKFRKCIGLKQPTKRFYIENTSLPKPQKQQTTFFINSIEPFLQIVQSQQKVFLRNRQQRPKKLDIYMLPDKKSRHYKNMRKKYYNQKVKELRVKNRAEDQIKCKNFIKQYDDCSNQMLANSLFYEKICMNSENFNQDELQNIFQIKHLKQTQASTQTQNSIQGLSRRKTKFFGGARASKIIKLKPFIQQDQNNINSSHNQVSTFLRQKYISSSRTNYRIFQFQNLSLDPKPKSSRQTKILKRDLSKRYNHFFTEIIK